MAFNKNSAPRASKGQVTIQIEVESEYIDIGCLVGDVSIGRSHANNATEDDNWCIHQDGTISLVQAEVGALTITSSITIEAMLSDAAYQFLYANKGAEFPIRFVLTDGLTPQTTQTLEYVIVKTSDQLNMRGGAGQTTQFGFDFQVNEITTETIVTA